MLLQRPWWAAAAGTPRCIKSIYSDTYLPSTSRLSSGMPTLPLDRSIPGPFTACGRSSNLLACPRCLLTIHRPDHCDGTFDSNCDASRAYTNITAILTAAGQTDLLSYMNTYWISDTGTNEAFWEHEWGKHGTCISTLEPDCYTSYTPQEEVVDFFNEVVTLFKSLPSYTWLSNAGIVPSSTTTYTSAAILAALKAPRGVSAVILCENTNELDEIWYFYDVKGSVQTGTFIPTNPSKAPPPPFLSLSPTPLELR